AQRVRARVAREQVSAPGTCRAPAPSRPYRRRAVRDLLWRTRGGRADQRGPRDDLAGVRRCGPADKRAGTTRGGVAPELALRLVNLRGGVEQPPRSRPRPLGGLAAV